MGAQSVKPPEPPHAEPPVLAYATPRSRRVRFAWLVGEVLGLMLVLGLSVFGIVLGILFFRDMGKSKASPAWFIIAGVVCMTIAGAVGGYTIYLFIRGVMIAARKSRL